MGEITETSSFGEKTTTELGAEAQPQRTKYLTASAVVIFVLTIGVLLLTVTSSRGDKAHHKGAIEVTENGEPETYVYKRRKATAAADKGSGGHAKKSRKTVTESSRTAANVVEKTAKATGAPPSPPAETALNGTSPPVKRTEKPAENAKPRMASKKPIVKSPRHALQGTCESCKDDAFERIATRAG
ncbi:hypothetical protein MTO96_017298 [Rhipicephalus appendiculatus]